MGPTPHDEGPSAPIARRTAATSEEFILAHVTELDHAFNEALHRLSEADQRISLMEAELTHFRDTEFSPLKTRVAAMESLNTHSRVSRDTQAGARRKKRCPMKISLGSRSTLRGAAERAALVSGIQVTTSMKSTQ
jgi:hypothetical protein